MSEKSDAQLDGLLLGIAIGALTCLGFGLWDRNLDMIACGIMCSLTPLGLFLVKVTA